MNSDTLGGLAVGTFFIWVSSVALSVITVWFLINWDSNFIQSLAIISLVVTLALFGIFVTGLDVVIALLGTQGTYLALSAFPIYNPLTFTVVTICVIILGFVVNKSECSKKLVIISFVSGALSITVPSFCFHAFWVGVATVLYPIRVGSVLLVLLALVFALTFAVFVSFLLLCSCKDIHKSKQIEFRASYMVLTALLISVISFLTAMLVVYVTPVSIINSSSGDPVTSVITLILPIIIGLTAVRLLRGLVCVSEKKQEVLTPQLSGRELLPNRVHSNKNSQV